MDYDFVVLKENNQQEHHEERDENKNSINENTTVEDNNANNIDNKNNINDNIFSSSIINNKIYVLEEKLHNINILNHEHESELKQFRNLFYRYLKINNKLYERKEHQQNDIFHLLIEQNNKLHKHKKMLKSMNESFHRELSELKESIVKMNESLQNEITELKLCFNEMKNSIKEELEIIRSEDNIKNIRLSNYKIRNNIPFHFHTEHSSSIFSPLRSIKSIGLLSLQDSRTDKNT